MEAKNLPGNNSKDVGEIEKALKVSYEADTTLAYSSEKLGNLRNLLLHVLENDCASVGVENGDHISEESSEKALTFDLLFSILDFELSELENTMCDLQALILDALYKISSCEYKTELLVSKLQHSEELLKQSLQRILETKIQSAKLKITSFSSKQHEWENGLHIGVKGEVLKPEIQTSEQRLTLRTLEKSLSREMELEKKITELIQSEEDSRLKIQFLEQVAVCMEQAAEVASGRFLETDNTAEILMAISKEMAGKLQIAHLNLITSNKREEAINSKLPDFVNRLNAKEDLIAKLNSTVSQLLTDNAEVTGLREKVQMLEEKLKISESRLDEADISIEVKREQLKETEGEIESLREKVANLTELNLELTEELDFLKGSNDSNTKKASVLEKQMRELDIQLQHSRALSEASQEQQNMLYSAIWDMETLIDELKQKVAKAENAEERCILLSEKNSEINKELEFVRSRMESMEESLEKATLEKKSCVKEVGIRTSLIMETVTDLAIERERIEKQLISLTKQNKLLRGKLQNKPKNASVVMTDNRINGKEEFILSGPDSESAKSEISSESFKVEKSSEDASIDEVNDTGFSSSANHSTNERFDEKGIRRRTYIMMAILVVVLSCLAAHLFQKKKT